MLRSLVQGLSCLRVHGGGLAQSGAVREALQGSEAAAARALPHPLIQHVRTTFVLRRKKSVHLSDVHKPRHRILKARHFVYELIEDTNVRPRQPIKLILKTSVKGLGSRGEVVEVAPHKARKELLLPGLAVYASPENLEKYSKLLVDPSLDDQPSSPFALSTAKLLSEMIMYVSMNKNQPWVIEPWHIRVAFRKAGVIVPEETIIMPPEPITGPDYDLQDKEFAVTIKINNKEEAAVRCRINHYTSDPMDRLPSMGRFWELPSNPIFSEQAALLEELNERNKKTASLEE